MMSGEGYNYCPRCGKNIPVDSPASQCASCGYEPPWEETATVFSCFNCGGSAPRGSAYCPSCGQPFTVVAPVLSADSGDTEESVSPPSPLDSFSETIPPVATPLWKAGAAGLVEEVPEPPELPPVAVENLPPTIPPKELLAWKQVNTERVFETLPEPPRTFQPPDDDTTGGAVLGVVEKPPMPGAAWEEPGGPGEPSPYASMAGAGRPSAARDAPTLAEGAIVAGRYRITRRLGSGGFANIYLVIDSEDYLQEELVLKLVDENLMRELLSYEGEVSLDTHDDLVRAWRSKLKAWKVISEQEPGHIVRLLGVPRIVFGRGRRHGVGMLMEYMPGGDLWQYFQARGVPRNREQLTETMRLFLSACRAVGVLHANRLLHRDIKPSNFLLNPARTQCKLSDFELIIEANEPAGGPGRRTTVGTMIYMAPECFLARYSVQSDIYALGAMFYHLLTGEHPRGDLKDFHALMADPRGHQPKEPAQLNPLISAELNEAILWCLDDDPAARPSSVAELQDELLRLGLTGDAVNIAPVNLARLLLTHLPEADVQDLVASLEESGFHSASAETEQRQRDIIEEYCYMASPYDVLKDNCTTRQLKVLTKSLGLKRPSGVGRDDLVEEILTSVGFLASQREVPGIEATRTFLENLRLNLAHATTMDECVGMVQAGLAAVERTVDLLLSFYGQLLLGPKLHGFLKAAGNGKPLERLTFGEKLGALRRLCADTPPATLPSRVRKVFRFPLIAPEVFARLGEVVRQRNLSAHSPHESTRRSLALAQRSGRQLLEHAVACFTDLAQNKNVPRVVQIVSRQDDVYGRHFYLGRDDHGRSERIFTPLPLNVGRLYLFFPLTNPARINPLIFPFDAPQTARHQ